MCAMCHTTDHLFFYSMKSSLATLFVCIGIAALGYGAYTMLSLQRGMQEVSKSQTETSLEAHPTTTSTMMTASSSAPVVETTMQASSTPHIQPVMKSTSSVETKAQIKEPVIQTQVHTVAVSGYAFAPGTLTVHVGDTVVWKNGDQASHTVTSDTGSELASDYFGKGMTVSHTFLTKGTFPYHCEPHPYMKGTIVVQ